MGADGVVMIPLAAHESAMTRAHKVVKWVIIGWASTAVVLGAVIFCYANAEYEVTTETTTTETTSTDESVSQDSGDSGYNVYSSGDVNGYPNGQ